MQRDPSPLFSIVIPTLNEAGQIGPALKQFEKLPPDEVEIIVVDGGSVDRTRDIAAKYADRVLLQPGGRAIQMNHGARQALGEIVLFLHADTRMSEAAMAALRRAQRSGMIWGRFDVRLSGSNPMFRVVEFLMNWRSKLTGVATGDQSIFVDRTLFWQMGGYPEIPLMEDVALSKKLRKIAAPLCLREKITTSSRRWEQSGVLETIALMWSLRLLYFFGVNAKILARWYR